MILNIKKVSIISFFLILVIVSCKKNDSVAPILTITSPIESSNFSAIDTLVIRGKVSDNFNVKSVSAIILNSLMVEVSDMKNFEINEKKSDLSLTYVFDNIYIPTGTSYYLLLTAIDDNGNETKEYIRIIIEGIETTQTGIYVCAGNFVSMEICKIDIENNIVPIININEKYKDAVINSYSQQISVLSNTGNLRTYNLPDNDLDWEKENLNDYTSMYYSKLDIMYEYVYAGSNSGYIYGYNEKGANAKTLYYNSTGFLPATFNRVDDVVYTYLFSSNTQVGRIEKLNYETGASLNTAEMDFDQVLGFYKYDTDIAIVFGNKNNVARVCTLGISNNSISVIDNFSDKSISSVAKVGENDFFIAIEDKIYNYKVSAGGMFEVISGFTARKIVYNKFTDLLYIATDDKIRVYKTTGFFVQEYTYDKTIYDIDFLYNKSLDM